MPKAEIELILRTVEKFFFNFIICAKAMEEMSDEQLMGLEGVTSDYAAPLLFVMQLALKNQTIDKKVRDPQKMKCDKGVKHLDD